MASDTPSGREAAERAAAAWIAKHDLGEWRAADAAAFEAWLAESASHRVAYYRLNAAWHEAGRLRVLSGSLAAPELANFPGDSPAVLRPEVTHQSAKPRELLDGATPRSHSFKWRTPWTLAASVVLGLCIALAVYRFEHVPPVRFSTVVGALEAVPLADGSRVTLNTNSELQVSLEARARVVNLDHGEAYFEVAKDKNRPFIVNAGHKRVIAVGTQFSVRRDGENVEVIVTEGTVRMEDRRVRSSSAPLQTPTPSSTGESPDALPTDSPDSAEVVLLAAGSVARAQADTVLVQTQALPDIEQRLSWRSGLLTFRDTPLAEVVTEFNRYNERKIVLTDPSIASLPLGGIFRATDIDPFIQLLEQGFPVRATQEGDRILLKHN